jgi:hypothetical protein
MVRNWTIALAVGWGFAMPALDGVVGATADCRWAEGRGEVALDAMTHAEARQLALRRARNQAIEKALGVNIESRTLIKDFSAVGDYIKALARGFVVAERDVQWAQDKFEGPGNAAPIPILRVRLKACVEPAHALRDAGFHLKVELNKGVFTEGEKATLAIQTSRPAHVAIFNLTGDDRVLTYHQLPPLSRPLPTSSDHPVAFPPSGVSLTMQLPAGAQRTSEAFIVVATKAQDGINLHEIVGMIPELSLTEFYTRLASVESDLVEDIVPYQVVGKLP